jgi:glycine dehydrogenase subunit 1
MPGRIVGRTVDLDGKSGFTLTLQAREQHIRRSKATSNICTNQGLLAAAATVYMALMGPAGLERTAAASHNNTRKLVDRLTAIDGVERVYDRPFFHEALLRLNRPADEVLQALAEQNVLGGYHVVREYPELENCLLVCATETKEEADIEAFATQLASILSRSSAVSN